MLLHISCSSREPPGERRGRFRNVSRQRVCESARKTFFLPDDFDLWRQIHVGVEQNFGLDHGTYLGATRRRKLVIYDLAVQKNLPLLRGRITFALQDNRNFRYFCPGGYEAARACSRNLSFLLLRVQSQLTNDRPVNPNNCK